MGRFTKSGILVEEYNLSAQDFFEYTKNGHTSTIVRRAGIEKIAKRLGITFYGLQVTAVQLLHEPMFIAVINAKKRMDDDNGEGSIKIWSDPVNTSASAAPSNCIHNRYIEIVENRVKDRAILQLADLHELHVHSEGASAEFEVESNRLLNPKAETKTPTVKSVEPEKPISKIEEVEMIAKRAMGTEILSKSIHEKFLKKKNNDDLLK